ncbi:MAG TPA: iron-sulfur cluster assembly scaffold protein [Rhodobacteraceae bacterium]|jgi:NifU-like protein involved in Fe-S cluster formation|nr:iron-sulfur cluster assembly scaffold protein [Paracoccaceae bacterium]
MSVDSDLIKLYSGQILALAADIPLTERLESAQASVKERAPLCGSTVTIDLNMEHGKVVGFGQDVKACALGQAAASVVASHIIGRTSEQVFKARDQLSQMLRSNGPVPDAPFDGLKVLEPARDFKNRHDSILLALEAVTKAIKHIDKTA